MFEDIHIKGFRRFTDLHIRKLRTINLIVGRNNSGKTSILEAVEVLASGGSVEAVLAGCIRRGEGVLLGDDDKERRDWAIDPGFLFTHHEFKRGAFFEINSARGVREEIRCSVIDAPADAEFPTKPLFPDDYGFGADLCLELTSSRSNRPLWLPLSRDGGIPYPIRGRLRPQESPSALSYNFLTTESLASPSMARLWDSIALTPDEHEIISTLRLIDDRIERMAFLTESSRAYGPRRPGVVLKLSGSDLRVPLGTLGDGIRRVLALSLAVLKNQNGLLLIDEIDTGLHYSALPRMWEFVVRTALRRNVQVFATTHSYDCIQALAEVCHDAEFKDRVALHRIEMDETEAVTYSGGQIHEAVQRELEMR